PSVGGTRPMMASASVDLPQPDSPTRPRHSPGFTSKVTPSTAFRVFTPPEKTLPTVKCTARSFRARKVSAMMVAPHEAASRQRRDLRSDLAADIGDGRATRIEAAARGIGRDRRHHARDLAQALPAVARALAKPRQRVHQALRVGMA